jgi:hypothetical protein
MERKKLLIILGIAGGLAVIACIVLFVVIFGTAMRLTQPAADASDAFLTTVQQADYAGAYGLCSSELQGEFGSAANLEDWFKSNGIEPVEWSYSSRNVSGDTAELIGSLTLTGGQEAAMTVILINVGDDWRVHGFHLE